MSPQGYYRYPTINGETVVFASEGDLWEIPAKGGLARRITSGKGTASHPCFSFDGKHIAYSTTEEGHAEVYVMPHEGGRATRLTHTGDMALVIGWLDNKTVLFASAWKQPFQKFCEIFKVSIDGGLPEKVQVGPANFLHNNPDGKGTVIQRHGSKEYGYWKRYKGGMAGQIWVDEKGNGDFKKLIDKVANFARPLWIKDRVYFTGDHEGHGILYSTKPDGSDLREELSIPNFYIRNQSTDGEKVVFHAGADLYFFDPAKKAHHKILIEYPSTFPGRNRKFVSAQRYIQDYDLHPQGHHISMTARGSAFAFSNFEGPTLPLGHENEGRYRISRWLHDGTRIVVVNDTDGEEMLELFDAKTGELLSKMKKPEVGRVVDMITSPTADEAILTNHKNELVHVNLKTWKVKVLDRSTEDYMSGMDWSPDGKWAAYGCSLTKHTSIIKLVNIKSGKITHATKPILQDGYPSFDPDGKYLYFTSHRQFNPVYDTLQFDLSFPMGSKPYLITLQKDLENPFVDKPQDLSTKGEDEEKKEKKDTKSDKTPDIKIDLAGIEERVIPFPLGDGDYGPVVGLKGKALYTKCPLVGTQDTSPGANLNVYDFETQQSQALISHVKGFDVSKDHQWLIYTDTDNDMRVVKAGEKPEDGDDLPAKKQGWISLSRLKVPVTPDYEWRQIYKEAWRLQRDHFWVEDMSKVDWLKVYNRYWPLVDRIGTREELNDILWEMNGELGTSHAYAVGGDLKKSPAYTVGMLGADFAYDKSKKAYKITHLVKGDVWKKGHGSPLTQPGLNIQVSDFITEIAGRKLDQSLTPQAALVNYAGQEVRLKILPKSAKTPKTITVRTLRSEYPARYREWVEINRDYVHKVSKGKIGYVHIPDMSAEGFAEFHRSFLAECDRDGLVVDVRFNGGGHVSQLLLEKLARKHLGYDLTRWMGVTSYPEDSVPGPLVAITNEYAGSDGDMFSHGFKLMGLGKLVGKRTWGGVIGIHPRHSFVDKGYTTQPEFSFWFKDIGWKLENYGAEPDVDVEMLPKDYTKGQDPQLDKALEIVQKELKENPVQRPDFSKKPNLKLPA